MTIVGSIEELEAIYGEVNPNSLAKESKTITPSYRRLIEASPFMALATVGVDGLDCSPRGDHDSVVEVVDERTIHIPDRRGNNRLDSLRNIVLDPRVALLFLIPGLDECVRVNGRARIHTDDDLRNRYVIDGKAPRTVISVEPSAVYYQCARAIRRSLLWDPDRRIVDRGTLPTPGQVLIEVSDGAVDGTEYDRTLADRQAVTLY